MTDLQKCSRCKPEQELKYFSINKKGQLYKTCDICRNKRLRSPSGNIIISDAIGLLAKATQTLERIIKEDTTPSDTDSKSIKDTDKQHEPPIMVFDVEYNGCTEAFILQLSWGLYKRDGTLIEMKDYFLKPKHEISASTSLRETQNII